jgi:hypothetical protein
MERGCGLFEGLEKCSNVLEQIRDFFARQTYGQNLKFTFFLKKTFLFKIKIKVHSHCQKPGNWKSIRNVKIITTKSVSFPHFLCHLLEKEFTDND